MVAYKGDPYTCATIQKDCNVSCTDCTGRKPINPHKKPGNGSRIIKPVIVYNEVGAVLTERYRLFTMEDNGDVYIYNNGVYTTPHSKSTLERAIREIYIELYLKKYDDVIGGEPDDIVAMPSTDYVSNVFAYLRAFAHLTREAIDASNSLYLNFKNGLFDLNKWKLIEHTPDIISICQFNMSYDETATCPNITNFFKTCELTGEDQRDLLVIHLR